MDEKNEMGNQERMQTLLQEISSLNKENQRLRKLLEGNGIILKEKVREPMDPNQGARIVKMTINENVANHFFARFWGRMDVYSQRIVSRNGKVGYYPQCWNFWKDGCKRKQEQKSEIKKGVSCMECSLKSWKHVDAKTIIKHLKGEITIGVYPMLPNGTCRFLVFDFDNHTEGSAQTDFANTDNKWQQEVEALREICALNQIDALVERSRSGRGAHVWIFFEQPIAAKKARDFGKALLQKGAEAVDLHSFQYYDRMIPAQDYLKDGGLGNLIALPLQAEPLIQGNSAFVDESWNAYPDQLGALNAIWKIKQDAIDIFLKEAARNNPFEGMEKDEQISQETGERSKPWKKTEILYPEDVHGKLRITLSNLVYVDGINLMPRIRNQIRRLAAFSNPIFYKNQAMNLSNFSQSRFLYLGEEEDGYIGLPRGLREKLEMGIQQAGIPYELTDERQKGRNIQVSFKGELRENQRKAVEALLTHETGILSAATAFGKTVVCCDLIAERKTNTLILIESSALMEQWQAAIERFLNIDEELPSYQTKTGRTKKRKSVIGMLQGAKDTLTGIVDIAMVGSVFSKDVCHPKLNEYGMVLVDECHHAASETIQKILRTARAQYVYGVTATPMREDGLEKINYMLLGPIRFRFTAKERALEQGIRHLVYPRFTRTLCSREDKLSVNDAYELVRDDPARNQMIIEDMKKCIEKGRCPVILTRYTAHAEALYKALQGFGAHTFLLLGNKSAKEKKQIVAEMKMVSETESVLLVATGKLIGEGFDFPRLDTLIMATPVAGRTVVEQYAGRLNRDYHGKHDVIIYDYIDVHIPVFERMYGKRLKAYKKIGYQIYQHEIGSIEACAGFIYDSESYLDTYRKDLMAARKEIVICSPGLRAGRVQEYIRFFMSLLERGVRITVVTWQMDFDRYGSSEARAELLYDLRTAGVDLRLLENISEHFTVIDREVVWYGSMNFLGKEDIEDNLMRICNSEAAAELLENVCAEK